MLDDLVQPLLGLIAGVGGAVTIAAYTRVNCRARRAGSSAHWSRGMALAVVGMSLQGAGWALLCLSGPWFHRGWLSFLGGALCLGALALYAVSARWVGRWKRPARYRLGLETHGIYRLVRHPQALALCTLVVGLGLASGSVPYLLTLPLWLAFWIAYTFLEERWELIPTFGDAYLRYREHTPRLIPRLRRPKDPGGS